MTKVRSFLKFSVPLILVIIMMFSLFACGRKETETAEGTEIKITVSVTNKAGETVEQEVTTTGTTLADALIESGIVAENMDDYGLYILTVNGETADYSVDQSYWAVSKNGEYLMTGASSTKIADGEHYELVYTVD